MTTTDEFAPPWDDEQLSQARVMADDLAPEPDGSEGEPLYDSADPKFVQPPRRKNGAGEYERKIRAGINTAVRFCVENEATVPDAAILLLQGPSLAQAWGDAAAYDRRIGKVVDFITRPAEDPVSIAIMTTIPVVFQMLRNHEPQLEHVTGGIRIPFRRNPDGTPKRLRIRFGIKLRRLRPLTNDPAALSQRVFTDRRIVDSLLKQGVNVAGFVRTE